MYPNIVMFVDFVDLRDYGIGKSTLGLNTKVVVVPGSILVGACYDLEPAVFSLLNNIMQSLVNMCTYTSQIH